MTNIRGGSDASRLHQGQADGDGKPFAKQLRRIASLRGGRFGAVRPGSNFLSLFEIDTPLGIVVGEEIDAMQRAGLLTASPMAEPVKTYPAEQINMPDACAIEIDHWWQLTSEGCAIKPAADGEGEADRTQINQAQPSKEANPHG